MTRWRLELFDPATSASIGCTECDNYFRAVEQATDHAIACFATRSGANQLLWTAAPDGALTQLDIREGADVHLIARIERT